MVILLGDIHGNFEKLKFEIENKRIDDCTIIQVGDFGIGFHSKEKCNSYLVDLNDFLSSKGIRMLVIRGNHDNPSYFNGDYKYSNLELLKDYTVLDLEESKFLFIGGAVSIDRLFRKDTDRVHYVVGSETRSYWEDETLKWNDKVSEVEGIDYIITHTAPSFCYPDNRLGFARIVEEFADRDKFLKTDLAVERNLMDRIFKEVNIKNKIKKHFYGHFHSSAVTNVKECEHRLLNIFEFWELR
jgi:UDP-2,3-diacylglucosamine pyrophosphatase LpxH